MNFIVSVVLPFFIACLEYASAHQVQSIFGGKNRDFSIDERGQPYTKNYVLYFRNKKGPVSPLHDVPLFANKEQEVYHMIVEVPRWTNAKMETNLREPLNPIKQEVKGNGPTERVYFQPNPFPHHGYIWNYGCLPQTWENPNFVDPNTGKKGDDDAIDAIEIGQRVANRGDVIQVKILGAIANIEDGNTDWKVVTIDASDPLAPYIKTADQIEEYMPGYLNATYNWLKVYRVADGYEENTIALDGKAKGKEFATTVVHETHNFWKALINKEIPAPPGISVQSTTLEESPYKMPLPEAEAIIEKTAKFAAPKPIDPNVHKWHFAHLRKLKEQVQLSTLPPEGPLAR